MPVPIPEEFDPFAKPGEWVFVNQQWLPILIGTLSYALNDWYWTGEQTERSQVIQSVLRLIDGMGELLPPETVKEVTRYIEEMTDDTNNEECEGDCMACNCGNSANVRYCEDTGLEYKGSDGIWRSLSVVADSIAPDDETPVGETPPPEVNQNACEKANALWDILFRYMEAIEETVPVFDFDPIPISLEMSQMSAWWVVNMALQKPYLPMKKVQAALYTLPQWFAAPNFHVEMDFLQTNAESLKDDFICTMTNVLSKDPKLTDSDLEKAYEYEWVTGMSHLNNMLSSTLHYFISEDYMKEQAALYVRAAVHVCNCTGNTPIPPPQEEPEEDEFGLFGGEIVGNVTTAMSPSTSREAPNPRGVKVSETKYTLPPFDAGDHQIAELFVMWEASEPITQVMWDTIWKYTGTPSDGSNITEVHFKLYYAEDVGELWTLMPSFVGQISTNDSASPEVFFGAVNSQRFPWDDSLQTWNARFLALHLYFKMESDNTPVSVPSGEILIPAFKAKASTGGNYRATFQPLQWVPKTL